MPSYHVRIDEIPKAGREVHLAGHESAWRESLLEVAGGRGEPGGEASVRLHRRRHRVEVHGRYEVALHLECSRCLDTFPHRVVGTFRVNLLLESRGAPGAEAELTEADLDDSVFQGDVIDVLELLREQVLLELPAKPLCAEECKGICPDCGADLNTEACRCSLRPVDPRLAVLARLRPES